jgi:CDGSH-type Zn-finger protein
MDEPVIADKKPVVTELDAGTYYWCACGLSKNQPYCDGSHAGTSFAPIEFQVDEKKRVALCTCKRTCKSPFCDGAHKNLP